MSRNEPDTLFLLSVFEKNTKDIRQKLLSSVGFYSKVNQIHEVLSEGRTVSRMIKVICDICGRVMDSKGENTINLDFNAYESGMSRLKKVIGKDLDTEYNLCPLCAEKVYKFIKEEQAKERAEQFLIMEGGKLPKDGGDE